MFFTKARPFDITLAENPPEFTIIIIALSTSTFLLELKISKLFLQHNKKDVF